MEDKHIVEIKCPNCKGHGIIGLGICPMCGGNPMDPDTNVGDGKLQIEIKLLRLFIKQAREQGVKI